MIVLSYAGCSTCKKALRWLDEHGVKYAVRPIVDEPPSAAELAVWVPASGRPLTKWLNTRGQSYRALGKEKVAAATPKTLASWLAADGKLVKRPVVVDGDRVVVGFDEAAYAEAFGGRGASASAKKR